MPATAASSILTTPLKVRPRAGLMLGCNMTHREVYNWKYQKNFMTISCL